MAKYVIFKNDTFNELMERIDPVLRPICVALRKLVIDLHPNYLEVVWGNQRVASYGVGPKKMSEHYVYIAPFKNHVNLGFYHGALAKDSSGLLEGTGKNLRHVKIRNIEQTADPKIKLLLAAAIEERQIAING